MNLPLLLRGFAAHNANLNEVMHATLFWRGTAHIGGQFSLLLSVIRDYLDVTDKLSYQAVKP